MSLVKIEGNASGTGTFTIAAPNSNTNRTLTLPDATGTIITTAGGAAISGTTGTFSGTISGGSTVGVGGATPSASGAGITFPATQSASTDANTLDDYEEGTFTPVLTGSTSGTVNGNGRYTKIGRAVTILIYFEVANGSQPVGNYTITGLPFTSASGSPDSTPFAFNLQYVTFDTAKIWSATLAANSTTITLGQLTSANVATDVTGTQFASANTYQRYAGTYQT